MILWFLCFIFVFLCFVLFFCSIFVASYVLAIVRKCRLPTTTQPHRPYPLYKINLPFRTFNTFKLYIIMSSSSSSLSSNSQSFKCEKSKIYSWPDQLPFIYHFQLLNNNFSLVFPHTNTHTTPFSFD